MKLRKLIIISLGSIIALASILLLSAGCNEKAGTAENKRVQAMPSHPSFVTKEELNSILAGQAPSRAEKADLPETRIVSAVLPHHLVAGRLIVNAMEILARQNPGLIILVGPNHFNKGARVITGFSGWQTPEGVTAVEDRVVRALLDKGLALRDEDVLSQEHSVGALVPFLKHFLPETRIVPLIVHHDLNLQEIDALLNALDPFLNEKAVLISSVDFSHYLPRSEAQAKDRETIRYMRNFDYATLFSLGNDYLDSPASLAAALRLAEKRGLKGLSVLDNTNSGIILQNDFMETTSYFTLLFRSQAKSILCFGKIE